jgi:hypothetical protein
VKSWVEKRWRACGIWLPLLTNFPNQGGAAALEIEAFDEEKSIPRTADQRSGSWAYPPRYRKARQNDGHSRHGRQRCKRTVRSLKSTPRKKSELRLRTRQPANICRSTSRNPAGAQGVQTKHAIEFRLAEDEARPGLIAVRVAGEARIVYLHTEVGLDDGDIRAASAAGR